MQAGNLVEGGLRSWAQTRVQGTEAGLTGLGPWENQRLNIKWLPKQGGRTAVEEVARESLCG